MNTLDTSAMKIPKLVGDFTDAGVAELSFGRRAATRDQRGRIRYSGNVLVQQRLTQRSSSPARACGNGIIRALVVAEAELYPSQKRSMSRFRRITE